ncbi:MAG: FAD-binding protein [Bacteroidota bacterium]|jgi:uncharacterized FAD-dependent dehydrogenase|nr:MAG: FAD-binding protein [Bacteroidota bacterium]
MKIVELVLKPEEAFGDTFPEILKAKLSLPADENVTVVPLRRSIDARRREVLVHIRCGIPGPGETVPTPRTPSYPDRSSAPAVIIVGCGPAGLFAAVRLLELGFRPVIVERGKDVRERRRDLAAINKHHAVNPDSNYCFGEGGAGTYSDGKLYTRSSKRGDVRRILDILVAHGAKPDILYDAHPHIGTNRLPRIIASIRQSILEAEGVIHFNKRVTDLIMDAARVTGVVTHDGDELKGEGVILATGHSARDIFHLLHRKGLAIQPKPFALGVRVEHPQQLIDSIQYHCEGDRGPYLPASSYALVHNLEMGGAKRGVFSFCMCPGGFMVPAATAPGEIVINGMSPSRRDSRFANSGIVVSVSEADARDSNGPLALLEFQENVERLACAMAGGTQAAPAQRLVDFVNGRVSSTLAETSYQPGVVPIDLRGVLPDFVSRSLQAAFRVFGKKMKGYLTNEAQVVAVESRTSSPIRIPRDAETLMHPQARGLFPCGEGAGYAGGIMSAAMDGERCAEAFARVFSLKKL